MEDIRLVLIEDDDLTRLTMRTALKQRGGFEILGEAVNGIEGFHLIKTQFPDVAVVDIGLPGIDGIDLTRRLKQDASQGGSPRVLILTLQDNEAAVLAAFAAGADSYCMKDTSIDNLVEALRITHDGNAWIDPAIARIVLQRACQGRSEPLCIKVQTRKSRQSDLERVEVFPAYDLTERELEVLHLIVEGASNAAIAEDLHITIGTVKTHVRNILSKLCASDRTQAAVLAIRAGLVE